MLSIKLATLATYVNISKRSVMIEGVASVDQRYGCGSRSLSGLFFSRDKGHEGTEHLFHEKRKLEIDFTENCLFVVTTYESLHSFEYLEMETPRAKSRVEHLHLVLPPIYRETGVVS